MASAGEILVNYTTSYPDMVIEVGKIIFGEKERNYMQADMRKIQNKRLTRAAVALLNSGGGVIKAEIGNKDPYIYEEHGLGLDIESTQRELVQPEELQNYFDHLHQNNYLLIFVKSWITEFSTACSPVKPPLCGLSTGLYHRSGTSVVEVSSSEALVFLNAKAMSTRLERADEPLTKKPFLRHGQERAIQNSAMKFFERDQLKYMEILTFTESIHVEFKNFPTSNCFKRVKEIIQKYVCAFANTEGGYLLFGVDDRTRKVIGLNENISHDTLKQEINQEVQKLCCLPFGDSADDLKWQVKIMPVMDDAICKGPVCAIKIEPFNGALFFGCPEYFIVHENGIKQLNPKEWKDKMMATDPDINHLSEYFNTALSISGSPPTVLPVYTKKGLECLEELKEHLFKDDDALVTVKPKALYDELSNEHPGLRGLMEAVPRSRGFLIFSRSWAVDVGMPENPHVLCDALFIALGAFPTLYTVYNEPDNNTKDIVQEYSRSIAYIIKHKLVNVGGYPGKLCVIPKPFNLCKTYPSDAKDVHEGDCLTVEYPYYHNITSIDAINALQKALVIVLLSFRSLLSDHLGCEFFSLLTIKQFELLSNNLRKTRKLFIHGLPGTGKTVVAMKIIEKIRNVYKCRTHEILYVCENQPLQKYIQSKNICMAVTRTTFSNGTFPFAQHVIIDEAQNFRLADGDWLAKAEELCSRSQNPSGPGVLWVFFDYFQKYHSYENGLPSLNDQVSKEWLTKCTRNAMQIYHVMRNKMEESVDTISGGSLVLWEHLQHLLQEAECAHQIPGFYIKKSLDIAQLAKYVAQQCNIYFRNGYSAKDIAILCNTEKDISVHKHNLQVEMRRLRLETTLVRADDNLQLDGIVLDSVRRFSGLEKNIVFGIHPVPFQPEVESSFLLCLASRANMKLHIIFLN